MRLFTHFAFVVMAVHTIVFAEQQPQQTQQPQQAAGGQTQTQGATNSQGGVFKTQNANAQQQQQQEAQQQQAQQEPPQPVFNFEDEDAYIDVEDALHSKQFVHRHLLSKTISDAAVVNLGRYFLNVQTTTSYVHQEGDGTNVQWAEFVTGGMALSFGYTMKSGHVVELEALMSAVSQVALGYRYFFGGTSWSIWPYAGVGFGTAMSFLNIADGPFEAQIYKGSTSVLSAVGGMLLPVPDIALRIQVRVDLWGSDRAVFTPSLGVIFFM